MPSSLRKSLKAASPEPAAPDQIKGKGKSDGSMQKGQVTDNGEGNSSASMPKGNSDVSKGKSNSANASTPQGKGKSEDSKGKSNSDAPTPEGKGKGKSEDSKGKGKDKSEGSKGKSNSDASTPQEKGKGKSEDSIGKGNSGVNQITPLQVFEEAQLLHQKVDRLTEKIDMLLLLANESAAANSAAPASGSMATLVAPTPIVPKAAPWQCQLPLVPFNVGHFSMLPPGMGPPPPPREPPKRKYIGKDWCQAFFVVNK